jgi:thioesterase domain-containing protein
LGPDQPVYGFTHQGIDGRRARYTTIKEIAAYHLSAMRSIRPHGPYFVGGYCIGAVIAYEIAQTLCKEGQTVPLLVLMAPDRPTNLAPKLSSTKRFDAGRQMRSQPIAQRDGRLEFRRRLASFAQLSARDKAHRLFLSAITRANRYLRSYIVSPTETLASLIVCRICFAFGMRLPLAVREFYINSVYERAAKGYVAEGYNGSVVLFKPFQDPAVDLTSWQTLVGNGLEIHHVPGHHVDVLSNRDHVKVWADVLKGHMQRLSYSHEKIEDTL